MRRISTLVVLMVFALIGWSAPLVIGADGLPRTFAGCVASGGDVRPDGDELTCRLTRSYDFRVYGEGETECGEWVMLEVWGETRTGVVTYLLAPGKTVDLPELGEEDMVLPEEPLACLDD